MKKAERSVIQHIVTGDKTHPPRTSIAKRGREAGAVRELSLELQGIPVTPRPWEQAIAVKQGEIRSGWLAAAKAMENGIEPVSVAGGREVTGSDLAGQIRSYVASMPPVETERQRIKTELIQRFSRPQESALENKNPTNGQSIPNADAIGEAALSKSPKDRVR